MPLYRTAGGPWRRIAALACALPILADPATFSRARADGDDPWPIVAAATRDPATAAAALPGLVSGALSSGDWSAHAGSLTLYSADATGREAEAERFGAGLDAAAGRLEAAGFVLGDAGETTLIHVRPGDGPIVVVASTDGATILLREPALSIPPPSPVVPKRSDGPVTAKDVILVTDRALLETRTLASKRAKEGGPGSPTNALARRATSRVAWPDGTPEWLREAIVAWAEEAAFPGVRSVPIHVCGGPKTRAFAATTLFDPRARLTTSQCRVLGRAFGVLAADRTNVNEVVAKVAASADHGLRALSDAFGQDPTVALATVLASTALDPQAACSAEGTTPCPACRGVGHFEIACLACRALPGVACPACQGDWSCRSPHCVDGEQHFWDAASTPCRLCDGDGATYCYSCDGAGRVPCKACSGGRVTWPCVLCAGRGRVACRDSGLMTGEATAAPCAWCRSAGLTAPCARCGGAGVAGCRACFGTMRKMCSQCFGRGCAACRNFGYFACGECSKGRVACECAGKGRARLDSDRCLACEGTGVRRSAAQAESHIQTAFGGLPADEVRQNAQMLASAIEFMFSSMDPATGCFALREPRLNRLSAAGARRSPSTYANALVLGSLSWAGIGSNDPRLTRAWAALRADAQAVADGTRKEPIGLQAATLVLRALVAARDASNAPLIAGLIRKLVRAQRPSGYWTEDFDSKEPGNAYTALYAIEALWVARRGGATVSGEVWSRALAASTKLTGEIARSKGKSSFIDATSVASSAALAAIAKAGASNGVPNLDDVKGMPSVQQALAWLDRHYDVKITPLVNGGAMRTLDSDGGYAAYLYALERLCQLLSIDTIGGERWYRAGARRLRELQLPDGSFEELGVGRINGPVRTTDSAILFLVKATTPLTESAPTAFDDR